MMDNGFYFTLHEMFSTGIVVHPLQVAAKGLAMVYPSIKVLYGGFYTAVGCIEHGEFAFKTSTGCKHGVIRIDLSGWLIDVQI